MRDLFAQRFLTYNDAHVLVWRILANGVIILEATLCRVFFFDE